jgi:hypothetical protein
VFYCFFLVRLEFAGWASPATTSLLGLFYCNALFIFSVVHRSPFPMTSKPAMCCFGVLFGFGASGVERGGMINEAPVYLGVFNVQELLSTGVEACGEGSERR